jgi:toxin ParE1/3/4
MTGAVLSPRARHDLLEAIRWIVRDSPSAALALRDALSAAAIRIGAHPDIGVFRPDFVDTPYRFLALTGFPCVVVYNPQRTPPRIVRILQGARDIPAVLGGG